MNERTAEAIALLSDEDAIAPPGGFRLFPTGGGFNLLLGPVYGLVRDGDMAMGFRVLQRHVNLLGTCHGGVIATFADLQAHAGQYKAGLAGIVTPNNFDDRRLSVARPAGRVDRGTHRDAARHPYASLYPNRRMRWRAPGLPGKLHLQDRRAS